MEVLNITLKPSTFEKVVDVVITAGEYTRRLQFSGKRLQLYLSSEVVSHIEIAGEVFEFNPKASISVFRNFNSKGNERSVIGVVQKSQSNSQEYFWEAEGFKKSKKKSKPKGIIPVEEASPEDAQVEKASFESPQVQEGDSEETPK